MGALIASPKAAAAHGRHRPRIAEQFSCWRYICVCCSSKHVNTSTQKEYIKGSPRACGRRGGWGVGEDVLVVNEWQSHLSHRRVVFSGNTYIVVSEFRVRQLFARGEIAAAAAGSTLGGAVPATAGANRCVVGGILLGFPSRRGGVVRARSCLGSRVPRSQKLSRRKSLRGCSRFRRYSSSTIELCLVLFFFVFRHFGGRSPGWVWLVPRVCFVFGWHTRVAFGPARVGFRSDCS